MTAWVAGCVGQTPLCHLYGWEPLRASDLQVYVGLFPFAFFMKKNHTAYTNRAGRQWPLMIADMPFFFHMQKAARQTLQQLGAAGMFATPRPATGKIFLRDLGFEDLGPFVVSSWPGGGWRGMPELSSDALRPDTEALIAWQQAQLDRSVMIIPQEGGGLLWGKKNYII